MACLVATSAAAADLPARQAAPPVYAPIAAPTSRSFLSEIRVGGSAQDPSGPENGTGNLTGEILFAKPFTSADPFTNALVPRPHVGGSLNFGGRTSFAYAGVTWTLDITPQFFVEASFGGAVHNGNTDRVVTQPHDAALGCSPLFRESGSVGYRISPNWSVMATVEHLSNAGLCSQNRGLTNVGARIGYSF